ncbi:hypothetical protein HHK36_019644 [Tetracentron sinense]|uniref:Pentatricopeptide repeat-containing protein n=1 Tax=Tetracentron sinense TaxID=13715 RepID=A0A834YU11_TETSI|nr:hypothetical protein HHK36_019644 [Tetracentron sinense]
MLTSCVSCSPYANLRLLSAHPAKSPTPSSKLSHNSESIALQNNIFFSKYSKSKSLDQTLHLFRLLPHRDTITWNTVISTCYRHGNFTTALRLFIDMIISSSHQPDNLTFRSLLMACTHTNNYLLALQIHAFMIKLQGLGSSDLITDTCLMKFYSELGSMEVARNIFDKIPLRDVVAFTVMMVGYIEVGMYEEALRMFRKMMGIDNLVPNEFSLTSVLSACAGLSSLFEGKQIHAHIVKVSLQSDVFVGTALINTYAKCDEMGSAEKVFLEISAPNVVSWNTLMAGNFEFEKVLRLFLMMRESGVSPDHVTYGTVLRACTKDASLSLVRQIHGLVVKMVGAEVDVFLGGALFEVYVDHGCASDAQKIFDWIHGKDIMAFNFAIQGYVRNGHTAEAVALFHEALQMGMEPNEATLVSLLIRVEGLNQGKQLHALITKFGFSGGGGASIASSLITVYTEFHCLDDAVRLFDQVHTPDMVLWTSMISGFSRSCKSQEALQHYILMLLEGLGEPPNQYTFSSVLRSCANLAAAEEGKQLHAQIMKSNHLIVSDLFIASGLVDMYAKCGFITEARILFDKMPVRDIASWNAMITGLAWHGYPETALEIFQELLNLPNLEPNHITFVGVLSACSHGGLLEEGYRYFQLIREPTIDHYTCLVDLLARAGHLEEASNLIQEMPFNPNEVIWSSLLAASSIHGNIGMGEYSAKHLLQLNPKDHGTYVSLSNIYAAAGRWEDVKKIRKLMKYQGVRKNAGLSWLRVNGRTHVFSAAEERNMGMANEGRIKDVGCEHILL